MTRHRQQFFPFRIRLILYAAVVGGFLMLVAYGLGWRVG